ncbi:MAG: Ig-like domain-containing protein [Acidobacteriota bacterium]
MNASRARRAVLAAALLCGSCADDAAELRLDFDAERAAFVAAPVRGENAPNDARSVDALRVFVGEPDLAPGTCQPSDSQPPLLGTVHREGAALVFEPRAPWRNDLGYTACLDPGALGLEGEPRTAAREPTSKPDDAPPRVVSVWPASGPVPANLLRLYVTFDRPMRQRGVDRGVELLESGQPISDAFVAIPEGLWDESSRRLTLFLHPGRIKRGVGPRRAQGPALRENTEVTLRLAGLQSASGGVLSEHATTYQVVGDDRSSPDPLQWHITPPGDAGEALALAFDERIDVALAQRLITVRYAGDPVVGTPQVAGRRWTFAPETPWLPGRYEIVVEPQIEDLAGNRPGSLFDRALTDEKPPVDAPSVLPFEVP